MSLTLREKLLRTFDNPVYNTFTSAQAAARFHVAPSTVLKAVNSLRLEGHPIYRNKKSFEGRTISVYRLGTPSKRYTRELRRGNDTAAIRALNGRKEPEESLIEDFKKPRVLRGFFISVFTFYDG